MLWYNILKCFHIAHFAIFYVVKSNISRYFMSSIQTFRDTFYRRNHQYVVQASKKNQFVKSSFFCSSNSIIKEYDLVEKNVTKEVFDAKFSIQKNEMIMISQIMCRYWKRCYEFLCDKQFEFFASSRIREQFFYCSKVKHEMKLRMCSSMFLWIKFVFESNYLSFLCAIHVLNFRRDLFLSST
jgi:nitrous oxide reductase